MFTIALKQQEVMLNDGSIFTIREATGDDEDTLSKQQDVDSGDNVPKYLSSIIISPRVTPAEIKAWPISKKYYLLVLSRILSHGSNFEFTYPFSIKQPDGSLKEISENIQVDLNNYIPPFGEYFSLEDSQKKAELLKKWEGTWVKPISGELIFRKDIEGQTLTFGALDSFKEAETVRTLGNDMGSYTINEELKARNMTVIGEHGEPHVIENFRNFPARLMKELRTWIEQEDPRFQLQVKLVHPQNKSLIPLNLIHIPDFFYPGA